MPDWPVVIPQKRISFLENWGHSHAADGGSTVPDYGMVHKLDSLLQPATYRSTARGGAAISFHEQGNGTQGDGGWARVAQEWDRQESVTNYVPGINCGYTWMTAASAINATSISVNDRTGFTATQWIVVGQGTNTEIVQIASNYVAAAGAGAL